MLTRAWRSSLQQSSAIFKCIELHDPTRNVIVYRSTCRHFIELENISTDPDKGFFPKSLKALVNTNKLMTKAKLLEFERRMVLRARDWNETSNIWFLVKRQSKTCEFSLGVAMRMHARTLTGVSCMRSKLQRTPSLRLPPVVLRWSCNPEVAGKQRFNHMPSYKNLGERRPMSKNRVHGCHAGTPNKEKGVYGERGTHRRRYDLK
ncbi:hypothetical protein VNO77_22560 [Canavalia gladiata]|uniref:Uncharacterized protein n=1 Tax=Canavalia gladiata TaxID=3824 RepID=A0AAN9L3A6_CANGL